MILVALVGFLVSAHTAAPIEGAFTVEKGEVRFTSDDAKHDVPVRYRLAPHTFRYEVRPKFDLPHAGVAVFDVSFPSPVTTPHAVNNTVYCEYFKPKTPGKHPAVIVLDILDGKQLVSRGEALWLAQNDIPALVVILPYYGPRRPMGGRERLLSPDVFRSTENVRQAVLDCRRAAAWLASRPEVDRGKIGIVGTSLGSFIGGLAAAAEPTISTACLLLGGGGLVDAFYDHPKAAVVTQALRLVGITKATIRLLIDPVDPLTYAAQLKGKRLLLVAASRDDVVPPMAMKRLWEATGKPKIVWFDATHVGAALYAFPAMAAVVEHIKQ